MVKLDVLFCVIVLLSIGIDCLFDLLLFIEICNEEFFLSISLFSSFKWCDCFIISNCEILVSIVCFIL